MFHSLRSEIAIFGFYLLCFSVLASVLLAHPGFPLDDSWIYQTVARNLVQYHVLGFLPGVMSSGSSSLLWTLILSAGYSALPKLCPVIFPLLLSGVLLGIIGVMMKRISEADGMEPTESWIFAICPAVTGNFLWLGICGMEHVMFVALSLLTILLWFRKSPQSRRSDVFLTGGALGLLTITRPEGIALVLILILFRERSGRSWKDIRLVSGMLVAFAAVTSVANWMTSHSYIPQTMKGRKWLTISLAGGELNARLSCTAQWFTRILKTWHIFSGNTLFSSYKGLALLLFLAISILIVAGISALSRERRIRTGAVCLWAIFLDAIYLAMLPATGQGGRYQPLQLMLMIALLFFGLYKIGRYLLAHSDYKASTNLSLSLRACLWVLVFISAIFSLSTWRTVSIDDIDQINQEHGAMARWLATGPAKDKNEKGKIAVFDIGRIGYELNGSLIDLGGLTDKSYLPFLMSGRVPEYLESKDVDTVVLPVDSSEDNIGFPRLDIVSGQRMRLTPIKSFCYERHRWLVAMLSSNTAMRCQEAFHVEYIRTSAWHRWEP